MNRGIKNSIAFWGQMIPLQLLKNRNHFPAFLPFYHVVSDVTLDYIDSYVVRTRKQFEAELDYLLKYFKPVDLENIINSPATTKMHLSFDDGLKECYSIIAPVLKRKGIPATFFVCSGFVDNQQLFHRFKKAILESRGILPMGPKKYFIQDMNELDEIALKHEIDFSTYQPYMSLDEIMALDADGFTIGAHSLNHPEMWTLSEEDQYRQVIESMQWVIDHFQPNIKVFSFPFTDDGMTQSLFDRISASGQVDVTFGTAGLKYDSYPGHLQRIPVEQKQNWPIRKVIHFEYFYSFLRSIIGKNKVEHNGISVR